MAEDILGNPIGSTGSNGANPYPCCGGAPPPTPPAECPWRFSEVSPEYWFGFIETKEYTGMYNDVEIFADETGLLIDSYGRKYIEIDGYRYTIKEIGV